jgi:subtilisin-like proprotein convertase family protein
MKKIYACLLTGLGFTALSAQTFSFTGTTPISDNQCSSATIAVSGLPAVMDSTFGLCSVTVNITHTYDGDLDLWLVSASGDSIRLSNNQGGAGDNFTGTVFAMSAAQSITVNVAPFTGTFRPENSLNLLNNSADPNGTWTFVACDEAPGDVGSIDNVSITFCANPPVDPPSGSCDVGNGAACFCPDSTQDCDLLPDMLASADIIAAQHTEMPGLIKLSNATPNVGWGPMEIHPSNFCWCDTVSVPCSTSLCPSGDPPTQQLLQTLYHKSGNTITSFDTLTPGTMSYHPTHGHVHVNDWAEFTLRLEDTTQASPLDWPIIAAGAKISFCLINLGDCTNDYGYCRDSAGGVITMADVPNAPFGMVSGCGLDQGIYTGMLDIYGQNLPGMSIDLTNVCNGNYFIVSVTDPDNDFVETNDNNNWVAVPITLTQQHSPITTGFSITSTSGFSATVSNNNTNLTSFEWDFGDGNTDTLNNPAMHTYSAPGTYTITLTQVNPCGTYISTQVITITGISEMGDFSSRLLKAMPNPANGVTTISYTMPESGAMQLELYNLVGERVAVIGQGNKAQGTYSVDVDFTALGLADGTYIFRLTTPAHYSTLRVVNVE